MCRADAESVAGDQIEIPGTTQARKTERLARLRQEPIGRAPVVLLERERALRELDRYAWLLDSSVRIPGLGLRVGLDSLVGLVPGLGDLAGTAMSGYLIRRAWKLGASRRTLARMLGNVALETLFGAVPLVGDAFDAVFRANQRNVRLLRAELRPGSRPPSAR